MKSMDVSQRIERAGSLFSGPYNCSQSVALAFSDVLGLEEEEILRLMSGFGYGMGGERSVCGAVTGGAFVLSALTTDPADRDTTYANVKKLIDGFKAEHGTIECLELIGEAPGDEEFHSVCPLLIERVIRITDSLIP